MDENFLSALSGAASSDALSKKMYERTLLLCKESLDATFDSISEVIYEVYGELVSTGKKLNEDNYIFLGRLSCIANEVKEMSKIVGNFCP